MANILLLYPTTPVTFWSFDEALKMIDRKSAFPPLGLLTIAGMFPETYRLRVVDTNVSPLRDEDLTWADLVVTSSMIIHWRSLEEVIARCNAAGVPVLSGGPLPTQYCEEIEGNAVFYLGEAENGFLDLVESMLADPGAARQRQIVNRRGLFRDLDHAPLPRWDLIRFDDYSAMAFQITRGCPEKCTFCNIPALYGRTTRIKSRSRIIQELDALYEAGWRGMVMAVDDNLVGNRDAILSALEEVISWQRARNYPFEFNTQASLRLSDDPPLMEVMRLAGFNTVFVGVESPAEESLKSMGAQKNLEGPRPLLSKVRQLQRHGFEVQAGFILGLDTDPEDIADRMTAFIQEAGIPVAMVGILGVLRDTSDYRRFERAGRLVEGIKYTGDSGILNRELSYVPAISPAELLDRHRAVVGAINSPRAYFQRCLTLFRHRSGRSPAGMRIGRMEITGFLQSLWRQGMVGSYRREYWRFLAEVLARHPDSFVEAIRLAVRGHHLILTTQQALTADEMKVFLSQSVEYLELHCQGYRGSIPEEVRAYAGRLVRAVHSRFVHAPRDEKAVRHNARVLLKAARKQYASLRKDLRHQAREPWERFQAEIERILATYARGKRDLQAGMP